MHEKLGKMNLQLVARFSEALPTVTKGDAHLAKVLRANKKYFTLHTSGSDYMRRWACAKYMQQRHNMSGFDYFKTDYGVNNQCLHLYTEVICFEFDF